MAPTERHKTPKVPHARLMIRLRRMVPGPCSAAHKRAACHSDLEYQRGATPRESCPRLAFLLRLRAGASPQSCRVRMPSKFPGCIPRAVLLPEIRQSGGGAVRFCPRAPKGNAPSFLPAIDACQYPQSEGAHQHQKASFDRSQSNSRVLLWSLLLLLLASLGMDRWLPNQVIQLEGSSLSALFCLNQCQDSPQTAFQNRQVRL